MQRSWTPGSEEVFFIKVFVFNVYRLCLSLLLVFKNDSSELFNIYPTHKVDAGNKVDSFLMIAVHSVNHQPSSWHAGGGWPDQGTREDSTASSPPAQSALLLLHSLSLRNLTSGKKFWGQKWSLNYWRCLRAVNARLITSISDMGQMAHICHVI